MRHYLVDEISHTDMDKIKCECVDYCTARQKNFILDYVENIIDELSIKT